MEPDKVAQVLARYGVTSSDLLQRGMEAAVYAHGADQMLKLYASSVPVQELLTLQAFYAELDRAALSLAVPAIATVRDEGECVVVIERRLPGQPLCDLAERATPRALAALFERYLDAVLEVGTLQPPAGILRHKLYDVPGVDQQSARDWHQFLARYLAVILVELAHPLARDVDEFSDKVTRLQNWLGRPYNGPVRLIHGDIFPGNLLAGADGRVTALVDFGLFTMAGDPLFDVATAWVFFDMYDQLGSNVRTRLLARILARLGEAARPALYRYVLLYSVLSANTYAPDCSDGHYRWCVDNLNNPKLWQDWS